MDELLHYIKENIFNLISILIGILGIILAAVFYFKTRKVKRPVYSLMSFKLLSAELKKVENIEIKYLGKEIKNLTASKFAFWNGGRDTIDNSDIPESSKLTIKAKEDVIIYGAEIIYVSDDANQVQLIKQKGKNEFKVLFDYLDYCQGGIIKILHSGDSSNDLIITGKVKGTGNYKESEEKPNKEAPLPTQITCAIISIITIVGGIFSKKYFWKIFLISIGLLFAYALIKSLKNPKFPKNLKKKFND